MGLILDSSAIIARERKGQSAADVLSGIRAVTGPELAALSVISVIELEHRIWRAKSAAQASARQKFMNDLFQLFRCIRSPSTSGGWRRGSGGEAGERATRFRSRTW